MDGKNRAASSYLSPGNPPADKEQNDPLAQVFHNACSYNFFAMAELLHRLAQGEKGTPELSLRDDPALANSDPLNTGWFFKVKMSDVSELEGLMEETAYNDFAKDN